MSSGLPLLDSDGNPTPVTPFLAAHHALRRDADRFPRAAQRLDVSADEAIDALRWHWKGYAQALIDHHEFEDNVLFPFLQKEAGGLDELIQELEDEHHSLHGLIDEVTTQLEALPAQTALKDLTIAFGNLDATVTRHLDLEEERLVPVMLEHPMGPPPGAEGEGPGGPPDMDWSFIGPFMADGLDQATIDILFNFLPPPVQTAFPEAETNYQEQLSRWWVPSAHGS